MANDTLPMGTIFQACHDVLDKILVPIHYRNLTEMALQSLGVNIETVNYHRQIEDVREKLVGVGRMGTFYTGSPLCLVGLKCWFENEQLHLFNSDIVRPIKIIGSVNSGIAGAFEGLMRYPHMQRKNIAAPEEIRAMGCARGLVIENHVTDWFKFNWPDMILPPDNDKKWAQPCKHDFKIKMAKSRLMLVDIWGPNHTGRYTKPPKKKSTHLHLQCRLHKNSIIFESVIPGRLYDADITLPEFGLSPRRLVVWLNCLKNNLLYEEIKQFS